VLEYKKSYGRCPFSPLSNAWLKKKLFWVFHIGYQPSDFNVQGLGRRICKSFE
jgi:hypothetical protein